MFKERGNLKRKTESFLIATQNNVIRTNIYQSDLGGARGEMVFVVGNEHGDSSSNPGRESNNSPSSNG